MGPLLNTQEKGEKKAGEKGSWRWTALKKRSLPFFFSLLQAVYRAQEDSNASFLPSFGHLSRLLLLLLSTSCLKFKIPALMQCIFQRPGFGSHATRTSWQVPLSHALSFVFSLADLFCLNCAVLQAQFSAIPENPRRVLAAAKGREWFYLYIGDSIAPCPCRTTLYRGEGRSVS